MIFDWFTIVAQLINFVVLVWLMKRFLYKPILHAIDEREKGIAAKLADAADQESKAQQDRVALENKNEAFDRQRSVLLAKATEEAQQERQRLFAEVRQAAAALGLKHEEALKLETKNLHQAIGCAVRQELVAISRRVLGDLADTALETSMVAVFLGRLRTMDPGEKDVLEASLKAGTGPVLVRSGLALSDDLQKSVQSAMIDQFGPLSPVKFEIDADLVCGIELVAHGHKVDWSVTGYLASLEQEVGALLKKGAPNAV